MFHTRSGLILIIFVFAIGIIGSALIFYFAWEEWQFRNKLAKDGLTTSTTITECRGTAGSYGDAIYQFEVSVPGQGDNAGLLLKNYTGVDKTLTYLTCRDLRGEPVMIRYLPNDPTQSRVIFPSKKGGIVEELIGYGILTFIIPWIWLLWEFIKMKNKWEPYVGKIKKILDIVILILASIFLIFLISAIIFWWYISW